MSKSLKLVMIIGAAAVIIFTSVIGIAIYKVYTTFSSVLVKEAPEELKNSRVLTGSSFLKKTEFFKLNPKGKMEILSEGIKGKGAKDRQRVIAGQVAESIYSFEDLKVIEGRLIAAAEFGAFEFDPDGKLKRRILFEPVEEKIKVGPFNTSTYRNNLDNLRIVPLSRESHGFVSHSSMEGVTVFNENGDIIWNYGRQSIDLSDLTVSDEERDRRYEKSVHVLEATVGDLDNDGTSEFIVAMKREGIKVFSQDGKERWSIPLEYPGEPLMVEDLDGDGTNELIQIGKKVFDGNGKTVREMKGFSSRAVLVRETEGKKKSLVSCDITHEDKTLCMDESGETVMSAAAPLSTVELKNKKSTFIDLGNGFSVPADNTANVAYPRAVWVTLKAGEPDYLAIVGEFIGIPRANLYVYDSNGKLVFHELLSEAAQTIAVLPSTMETETFVVGGATTIWKYAAE